MNFKRLGSSHVGLPRLFTSWVYHARLSSIAHLSQGGRDMARRCEQGVFCQGVALNLLTLYHMASLLGCFCAVFQKVWFRTKDLVQDLDMVLVPGPGPPGPEPGPGPRPGAGPGAGPGPRIIYFWIKIIEFDLE